MKAKKIRMFELMNECERVDIESIKAWCVGIDCKALAVLHDKDTPRKAHYHIFVKMENARSLKDLSAQLNIEQNYIEKIKSWKNALAYAFHLTDNAKNDGKYLYDSNAVIFNKDIDLNNIFQVAKQYEEDKVHNEELKKLLYDYGECKISKRELIARMNAEDYSKFALNFKRMSEYRQMKVKERDMKVIYITGPSGSGKTTLAKYFARMLNYDYFVSGIGDDILDGYDKEECIILDDLRGDVFKKSELFKLTDNNTNSSVKSRYKNKDISYCKLMIITSVKTPYDLYNWETESFENKDESFKQFARRLGNSFLYLTDDENKTVLRCFYDFDDFRKTRKQVEPVSMSEVFGALGIEQKIGADLMTALIKKIRENIDDNKTKYEEHDDLPF